MAKKCQTTASPAVGKGPLDVNSQPLKGGEKVVRRATTEDILKSLLPRPDMLRVAEQNEAAERRSLYRFRKIAEEEISLRESVLH